VRLNTSFLRTLSTCSGGGTSGCYAPDGVHAEKPIENALKCNAIFISIFEEKDPEKAATKESRTIAEGTHPCRQRHHCRRGTFDTIANRFHTIV